MTVVTLEQSDRIIDAILARGRELGLRPLSVAVTDPGARLKAFKKEDDSAMMRFEMAMGKVLDAAPPRRSMAENLAQEHLRARGLGR